MSAENIPTPHSRLQNVRNRLRRLADQLLEDSNVDRFAISDAIDTVEQLIIATIRDLEKGGG